MLLEDQRQGHGPDSGKGGGNRGTAEPHDGHEPTKAARRRAAPEARGPPATGRPRNRGQGRQHTARNRGGGSRNRRRSRHGEPPTGEKGKKNSLFFILILYKKRRKKQENSAYIKEKKKAKPPKTCMKNATPLSLINKAGYEQLPAALKMNLLFKPLCCAVKTSETDDRGPRMARRRACSKL